MTATQHVPLWIADQVRNDVGRRGRRVISVACARHVDSRLRGNDGNRVNLHVWVLIEGDAY